MTEMTDMKLTIQSTISLANGAAMPRFGLGTWRSEPGKVSAAVEEALKLGYRYIDAAEIYRNQTEVGEGIARAIKSGYITREDLWVTSKLWITDYRQERVRPAVKKILKDLGLEYVDQILLHWPVALRPNAAGDLWPTNEKGHIDTDTEVDILKTWQELEKLVDEGWIKTLGVSNFSEEEVQKMLDNVRIPPFVNQVECHPYLQQESLKAYLDTKKIALVSYCPLANEKKDASALVDPIVKTIGRECSKTPAQVIIRWHLQRGVIVIPKTVTLARLAENAAVFDFELNDDQMLRLQGLGAKMIRQNNPKYKANDTPMFE